MADIKLGQRVLAFDSSRFENDVKTPLHITMRLAVVVRLYHSRNSQDDNLDYLAAIRWEETNLESSGHYVNRLKPLPDIRWPSNLLEFKKLQADAIGKYVEVVYRLQPWELTALIDICQEAISVLKRETTKFGREDEGR